MIHHSGWWHRTSGGAECSQGPRCGLGYTQGGCFGEVCGVQLEGVATPAHPMPFGWACIIPAHPGRRLHLQMVHHLSVTGPSLVANPNRMRCRALSSLLQSPEWRCQPIGRFVGWNASHWGTMSSPQWPHPCAAGCRHRPKARLCIPPPLGVHPGTPMFSIMGAGGHKGVVDTLAVHLHVATRCLVSSLVAMVPPSVNGMTSSHCVMSSSPSPLSAGLKPLHRLPHRVKTCSY